MVKVEWRPAARESLLEIVDYISDDNPDAAQALKDEIEEKIAGLTENPQMYRQGRVAGTRELVVRSNYVVIYVALADLIVIIQILHTAQQWP